MPLLTPSSEPTHEDFGFLAGSKELIKHFKATLPDWRKYAFPYEKEMLRG